MQRILFIINHKIDNQYSMFKYAAMHKFLINNINNKKFIFKVININNIIFKNSKNKIITRINKYFFFPIYLFFISRKYNIVHICDQGNAYLINFLKCKKIVVTCHDLILIKFHFKNLKDRVLSIITKKSLEKADVIIAASLNTKQDIRKYLSTKAKIYQIYHPVLFKSHKNKNIKFQNFILHIGNAFYKNRRLAINFFKFLSKKNKNKYSLVCIGEIKPDEKKFLKNENIRKNVYFIKNISEAKVISLYKKCRFLLVTSLYEGYGYPILEAYYYKKKIISTSAGSLKEIVLSNYTSHKNTVKSLYNVYKLNSKINKTKQGLELLKKINNKEGYKNFYNKIYSE